MMRFSSVVILTLCLLALGISGFCQGAAPPASGSEAAPQNAPAAPSASVPPPAQADVSAQTSASSAATISMNFENADINSVIEFLSMSSRIPIVCDPTVKGNVTIISYNPMTLQDAYEVISAALRVHGFAMVGGLDSKVIRVEALSHAITDTTPVQTGTEVNGIGTDEDLVTQVVPLEYASSDTLVTQLKPLVSSDQASLVSIPSTNTLVITDHVGNVKRLMDIIKSVDRDTFGAISVVVYKCQYASADNLVTTLNALFQPKQGAAPGTTPTAPTAPPPPGGGGGRGGRFAAMMAQMNGGPGGGPGQGGAQAGTPSTGGLADLKQQINITSDSRTNSLIISGTKDRIDMVLDVVKELDVDTLPEVKVKLFHLQYADATATQTQLSGLFEQPQGGTSTTQGGGGFAALFGGGGGGSTTQSSPYAGLKRNVVVADIRTNSIIVTATDQNMVEFADMIQQLDVPKVLSDVTNVYPLQYQLATNLAPILTSLFAGPSNSSTNRGGGFAAAIFGLGSNSNNTTSPLSQLQQITVIAEPKTNSLLVTGPPSTSELMEGLVKRLDKRGAQVFIEAAIVDVTLTKEDQFGVEWQWKDEKNTASTNFAGQNALTDGLKYSVINNNLSALLQALTTRNDVSVLSTPSISTEDNVQGKITIGEEVPEQTGSTVANGVTTYSVTNLPVNIQLLVTPHVNGQTDVIGLDIDQTINELGPFNSTLQAYTTFDREAATSVNVKDGQTIVIGGIIQKNKTRTSNGVPILESIPLLGNLFKYHDNTTTRTELMVFLTPRILKTESEDLVQKITQATIQHLSTPPTPAIAGIPDQGKASPGH